MLPAAAWSFKLVQKCGYQAHLHIQVTSKQKLKKETKQTSRTDRRIFVGTVLPDKGKQDIIYLYRRGWLCKASLLTCCSKIPYTRMGKDVKKILYAVKKNAWYKGCKQNRIWQKLQRITRKKIMSIWIRATVNFQNLVVARNSMYRLFWNLPRIASYPKHYFNMNIKHTNDLLFDKSNVESFNVLRSEGLIRSNILVWTGLRQSISLKLHVNIPYFYCIFIKQTSEKQMGHAKEPI